MTRWKLLPALEERKDEETRREEAVKKER